MSGAAINKEDNGIFSDAWHEEISSGSLGQLWRLDYYDMTYQQIIGLFNPLKATIIELEEKRWKIYNITSR